MIILEYSLLFLHFFFYLFFCAMFSEFVYISTKSMILKFSAIALVVVIVVLDAYLVYSKLSNNFICVYLVSGCALSLLFSIIMKLFRKLDLTVWLPFSVLFSPFIVVISAIFLLIVTKKISRLYKANLEVRAKIMERRMPRKV